MALVSQVERERERHQVEVLDAGDGSEVLGVRSVRKVFYASIVLNDLHLLPRTKMHRSPDRQRYDDLILG